MRFDFTVINIEDVQPASVLRSEEELQKLINDQLVDPNPIKGFVNVDSHVNVSKNKILDDNVSQKNHFEEIHMTITSNVDHNIIMQQNEHISQLSPIANSEPVQCTQFVVSAHEANFASENLL